MLRLRTLSVAGCTFLSVFAAGLIVSCGDSGANTAARPTVPVSGAAASSAPAASTRAALASNVVKLEIPKGRAGKLLDPSTLEITFTRSEPNWLHADWRYVSSNLDNGLMPNDRLSIMVSGDGVSSYIVNVPINPRYLGSDWQGSVGQLQGKQIKDVESVGILGMSATEYAGMTVSGDFAVKLPNEAVTKGTVAVVVVGVGPQGDYIPLAYDPPDISRGMEPANFRPFTYSSLPVHEGEKTEELTKQFTRRYEAGATLASALEALNERSSQVSSITDLKARSQEKHSIRTRRVELLSQAYADEPAMLPAALALLSHASPDELTVDQLLAPAKTSVLFLGDSLAYARRLLLRGRFDDWTKTVEGLFEIAVAHGAEAIDRMALAVVQEGVKDALTLAVKCDRRDLTLRIQSAMIAAEIAAGSAEPRESLAVVRATLDLALAITLPESRHNEVLPLLSTAINTLQANGQLEPVIRRIGSIHMDSLDASRAYPQWKHLVDASGVGPAGVTVVRSLGLLVRVAISRNDPEAAAKIAMALGETVPAEIVTAEPSIGVTWGPTLATAQILSSDDPARSVATWLTKLSPLMTGSVPSTTPELPQDDPRTLLAEDIASTATPMAKARGTEWLIRISDPLIELIRAHAKRDSAPQLLLTQAELLLSYGLADRAAKLSENLLGDFEKVASSASADQQAVIRTAMRRIPSAARLLATAEPDADSLKFFDTLPDNERSQFVQYFVMDAGHNHDGGVLRRAASRGNMAFASMGMQRLTNLLVSRKDDVRLVQAQSGWCSICLDLGSDEEMANGLAALRKSLDALEAGSESKYPEFAIYDMLAIRFTARQGKLQEALVALDTWIENNPKSSSKAYADSLKERYTKAIEGVTLEQASIAAEAKDLPRAVVTTDQGVIEFVLLEDDAPNTVAHFIATAESGFWNRKLVHRFLPGFVAQVGGDDGSKVDDLPRRITLETNRRHIRGSLSMARQGEDSAGPEHEDTGASDFFIVLHDYSAQHLDGLYSVFGRIVSGQDVLDNLRTHSRINSISITNKRKPSYTYRALPPLYQSGR